MMRTIKLIFQAVMATILVVFILVSLIFRNIGLSWVVVVLAIAYGLGLVVKYGKRWWKGHNSKVARRERFLLFLLSIMSLFLATGTALYLWAFYWEYEDSLCSGSNERFLFINAEYLLRSLVCSFQLFAASIDSNVLDGIKGHEYVKGLISLQAILSFSCTVAILISLAYTRVKAFIKFHKLTTIDEHHNHMYVFFGMNEPSRLLARSIHNKGNEKDLIFFVENSRVNEDEYGGWDSIVGMFTHRRRTFTDADSLNARVTFTETRLCDVDINDIDDNEPDKKDVLQEINLIKLKELILKLKAWKDSELHVFLFSEKEDENIKAMSVLAMDATINELNGIKNVKQKFYCHARQNGLNRVIEDIAVKRGLEVRIIDSSHLSIELLKADGNNHPVRLVDIDKDNPTTVKSEFNSMVVGFDEAGQDALKFLYEFGAFVSNEGKPEKEMRSPFHCVVVDKRMNELGGVFSTFAPAAIKQKNKDGSNLVELIECDCQSDAFYDKVLNCSMRKNLNYVIIAVGNDDLGMMLAIRILNHIRRDREDLSRLRIYVRSYRSDRESYMKMIADYYNEGYNQDCIKNKKEQILTDAIIIPFGQSEKIYTYDMIIREDLIEKGKIFQKRYCEINNEKEQWDLRRDLLTGVKEKKEIEENGEKKKQIVNVPMGERKVSLNDIRSLRRKEAQDLANALHAMTKIFLLKNALKDVRDWKDFVELYFDKDGYPIRKGSCKTIRYEQFIKDNEKMEDNIENKIILNLARLEHLRWVASHEMLGYTKADVGLHCCNERTRQHNCLKPWEELDKESRDVTQIEGWDADYKAYDFGVVDVSVWLYNNMYYKIGYFHFSK